MARSLHADVEHLLKAAGWQPGRREPQLVADWRAQLEAGGRFVLHQAAEAILLEFGGLCINAQAPGVNMARSDLALDPALAAGEEDRFFNYFPALQELRPFPLGEVGGGHGFLAITESGEIYLIGDEVYAHWPDFPTALDGLLRGVRPHN